MARSRVTKDMTAWVPEKSTQYLPTFFTLMFSPKFDNVGTVYGQIIQRVKDNLSTLLTVEFKGKPPISVSG